MEFDQAIPRREFWLCGPALFCRGAKELREFAFVFFPGCSNLHWSLISVRIRCLICELLWLTYLPPYLQFPCTKNLHTTMLNRLNAAEAYQFWKRYYQDRVSLSMTRERSLAIFSTRLGAPSKIFKCTYPNPLGLGDLPLQFYSVK